MKRFVCLFLAAFVLFSVFSVSLAEYPLSKNEKNFVGVWSMVANDGKGSIYNFNLTLLDNLTAYQKSMIFENGELVTNNHASGEWCGFTDNTIVLTLADIDLTAMIKDNGYLYVYFYSDKSLCGIYSRCEDMTSVVGW